VDLVRAFKPRETRLDRRAKVELFEQTRREYEYGEGTINGGQGSLGFTGESYAKR
jgi:hypothetical protein